MQFDVNVGSTDQKIRLGAGALLLLIALFAMTGATAIVIGLVGAVALATGFLKFCPAYRLLGMNTCDVK